MPDDKDKRAPAGATSPDAVAAESGAPADGARDVPLSVSPAPGAGAKSKSADPACPTCRGPLERYTGAAAHKLGSLWCRACGVRHRLPASAAADEGTGAASTSGTKAAG